MIINRFPEIPSRSFMLLGPRGTGKSTLIKQKLNFQLEVDLLKAKTFLPLSANPSLLEEWVQNLKPGSWVYIDEIQKLPSLMDEVHALYENQKLQFALSGSSARKLKRGGGNLLAGRALSIQLFPFTYIEYMKHRSIDQTIEWGSLPQVITDPENQKEYLASYVETYLREELMEEGLLRKLEPFSRFLQTAGIYNGQVLNIENIARESHVSRPTVDRYFEVIEDTLIGFRLESFKPKWNRKELTHPKFYLFDTGVARACAGLLSDKADPSWLGHAFETLIVNEVRTYNSYLKKNRNLFYYKYSAGYEIDLVIENRRKTLSTKQEVSAIEIKASKTWDRRWNDPLLDFQSKSRGRVKRLIGIYRGEKKLKFGDIEVFPVEDFLSRLSKGEFL